MANSANGRGGDGDGDGDGDDGGGVPVDGACVPSMPPTFPIFHRCFRVTRFFRLFCDFFDLLFLI